MNALAAAVKTDDKEPKLFFHHIRERTADGMILPNGGATLCYVPNFATGMYDIFVARCHRKDLYCKRIGRIKAEARSHERSGAHKIGSLAFDASMLRIRGEQLYAKYCIAHKNNAH